MAKKKTYDWDIIEKEYRAGQLSIREVARRHGCSESAIRKRAKTHGWKRDLVKKVRQEVRNKLVRTDVRISNASEREIVEQAATVGATVVTLHRQDIGKLRVLEQKILAELENEPTRLYTTQYQGEIVQKAVRLSASEKAGAVQALASVMHKRIALERQAFNLNESAGEDAASRPSDFIQPELEDMFHDE